jgi:hypothetical protein
MRLLLLLAGLAMSFALPIFAQEQKAVDPEVRQQIEAVMMKFEEAYNKYGGPAIAELHTLDSVEVRSWQGLASGRQAIEKRFAADFAGSPGKMVTELVQMYAIGKDICVITNTSIGPLKGHAVTIYVPARLIADPTRASSKRAFIVSSRAGLGCWSYRGIQWFLHHRAASESCLRPEDRLGDHAKCTPPHSASMKNIAVLRQLAILEAKQQRDVLGGG